MKKLIGLLLFSIGCLIVLASPSLGQDAVKHDEKPFVFEVELNKDEYLLMEPVFVKFKFFNRTALSQKVVPPYFVYESKLIVTYLGKTSIFNDLTSGGEIPGVRFPQILRPTESINKEEVFNSAYTGVFFPVPGIYFLQFELRDSTGTNILTSNLVEVRIVNPQGADKEAYDFMKGHKDFFALSSWTGKEGEALLETFVNRYSETVYGELAINSLGHIYLGKGELDKAELQFGKLKNSRHSLLIEDSKESLADIEKKKANLKKFQ
jgi:hypothetical protein